MHQAPMTQDRTLTHALREGSRAEHEAAESSTFVSDLFAGRVTTASYVGYLRRLLAVYSRLEALVKSQPAHSVVWAFHDPGLDRVPALRGDLDHWAPGGLGASGADLVLDSPAVRAYEDRLDHAAAEPPLLLAHHYTRYLGDLAGGQAVGAVLVRHHGLGSSGAGFYRFPDIPAPKRYRDSYRARLDGLMLTDDQRCGLVAEVREAFRLNVDLLQELSPRRG